MKPLSVIIVTWNSKEYLRPCLDSLFKGGHKEILEVQVIDNGSEDGTGDIAQNYPVDLIQNRKNLGFAKGVNQGLQRATCPYLLLLNPDTQIKEGSLEALTSFMDRYSKAGLAGAQLLNPDGSKQNSIANFPSLATELLNKNLLRWLFPDRFPGKERKFSDPIEVDSVIGACMVARREAIEQVGLLDEDYFLFFEETDWCYRMKQAGWKIYHVPQAEVIHFQGKSAEQDKKRAKVEYYRSRYLFFKKHRGTWQWAVLLVGLLIKLGIEFLSMMVACSLTGFSIRSWRKRLYTYAYLLWWHLRGCPGEMGLRPARVE